jgi:hypothetical protein
VNEVPFHFNATMIPFQFVVVDGQANAYRSPSANTKPASYLAPVEAAHPG